MAENGRQYASLFIREAIARGLSRAAYVAHHAAHRVIGLTCELPAFSKAKTLVNHQRATLRTIQVKVKPNARVSNLTRQADGTWLAEIKSPPVDGKANEELIGLLAASFKLRKVQVSIKSGAGGRMKLVTLDD